jgi:CMP-N-acetylneuraminic acid synthetase
MLKEYKILEQQVFSKDNYSLVPIRFEDRFDIMKWRNEQIYHLRQDRPLTKKNFDTVFPIIAFSFPIQRALGEKKGKIAMIQEENLNVRSQDLEERYHDAGQFYWCNTQKLLLNKKILTPNTGGIILSELKAQDIDTETDWKLAELKYQLVK